MVRGMDRARKKQTGALGPGWGHYRFAKEELLDTVRWIQWIQVHGPRDRGWDASACWDSSGSWNTREMKREAA